MTLGETVKAKRLEFGWTQEELARSVRRTRRYIGDIEADSRDHVPGEQTCAELARVLQLPPSLLLRLSGRLPEAMVTFLLTHEDAYEYIERLVQEEERCIE